MRSLLQFSKAYSYWKGKTNSIMYSTQFRGPVEGWLGWSIDHPRILGISIENRKFWSFDHPRIWLAKSLTLVKFLTKPLQFNLTLTIFSRKTRQSKIPSIVTSKFDQILSKTDRSTFKIVIFQPFRLKCALSNFYEIETCSKSLIIWRFH